MSAFRKLILGLSVAAASVPAFAGTPQAPGVESKSGIVDVVPDPNSGLSGRFLDGEGQPVDGAIATLSQHRQVVARTSTDRSGAYQFAQVQPGVYHVTLGTQTQTIRVWNSNLAPPAAQQLVTTVRADQIVRGQLGLIGGSIGSTVGTVGGVAGIAGAGAGGYSITQSMDAQDEADAAVQEAAELREMLNALMSP